MNIFSIKLLLILKLYNANNNVLNNCILKSCVATEGMKYDKVQELCSKPEKLEIKNVFDYFNGIYVCVLLFKSTKTNFP